MSLGDGGRREKPVAPVVRAAGSREPVVPVGCRHERLEDGVHLQRRRSPKVDECVLATSPLLTVGRLVVLRRAPAEQRERARFSRTVTIPMLSNYCSVRSTSNEPSRMVRYVRRTVRSTTPSTDAR